MFGQDDQQDPTNTDAQTDEGATVEPTSDDATNSPATVTSSDNSDSEAPAETPVESEDQEGSSSADTLEASATPPSDNPPENSDLLELKKAALSELAPLVDKLDQTPEEHFKTVMMLIQATDNPEHVKDAYEAAKKITDDSVRAQALLDIVNEINYFTQAHNK